MGLNLSIAPAGFLLDDLITEQQIVTEQGKKQMIEKAKQKIEKAKRTIEKAKQTINEEQRRGFEPSTSRVLQSFYTVGSVLHPNQTKRFKRQLQATN